MDKMYEIGHPFLLLASPQPQSARNSQTVYYAQRAVKYYQDTRNARWLRFLWARLTGRSTHLIDLNEIETQLKVSGRHYAGRKTVQISHIIGSEGRCRDFDAAFSPVQGHTGERWIGIMIARLQGMSLPPIELVQVGEAYFVRDGHHRISVARALGEESIDAEVITWETNEPLAWDRQAARRLISSIPRSGVRRVSTL
jgi:hypothetical protein